MPGRPDGLNDADRLRLIRVGPLDRAELRRPSGSSLQSEKAAADCRAQADDRRVGHMLVCRRWPRSQVFESRGDSQDIRYQKIEESVLVDTFTTGRKNPNGTCK